MGVVLGGFMCEMFVVLFVEIGVFMCFYESDLEWFGVVNWYGQIMGCFVVFMGKDGDVFDCIGGIVFDVMGIVMVDGLDVLYYVFYDGV